LNGSFRRSRYGAYGEAFYKKFLKAPNLPGARGVAYGHGAMASKSTSRSQRGSIGRFAGLQNEGVESLEQLRFLRANGCDEIQGYYLSKPITADEMSRFLKRDPSNFVTSGATA
jgi:hypothetical protein